MKSLTPFEHYREAERILMTVSTDIRSLNRATAELLLQSAQVHATLAKVPPPTLDIVTRESDHA